MSADLFLLLPVDRYRVEYEVGTGVPFSEFDLTILRSVAEDRASDLKAIAEMLALPPRLVIESLVGLARAGWVSIGARAAGFSATPLGQLAVKDPLAFMPERLYTREGRMLMERVAGQVGSGRGVVYHTWRSLQESGEFSGYTVLPRDNDIGRIDMGQVKALLHRAKNEWIRNVGEPIHQQEVWLKLHVEGDRIHGLPEAWRSSVAVNIARRFERPGLLSVTPAYPGRSLRRGAVNERAWKAAADSTEILFGRLQHAELLARALAEAKSQVLIASAFISAAMVENDLKPLAIAATRRGVRIDVLWGYSAGAEADAKQETLDALSNLKRACAGTSRFRFNEQPSGSHAKLLAWNTADDGFRVCSGSFNWLSVRAPIQRIEDSRHEVSMLTSNAGMAGDLCTTIASLWVQADSSMSGTSDLWQHTAALLDRQAAREALALRSDDDEVSPEMADDDPSVPDGEVQRSNPAEDGMELRQVRDQEHESLMRDMLLGATRRIGIVSHKIGGKGIVRLASLPRPAEGSTEGPLVRVLAGELQEDIAGAMGQVEGTVTAAGGTLAIRPGLHAKIVLVDDTVLISSYNFLSADPFATATNAREVGVLIKGQKLSDEVWAWIDGMS